MSSNASESERRFFMRQAIANTVIEGHEPSPEFLRDAERVVKGEITTEQAIEAAATRAKEQEKHTKSCIIKP